MLEMFFNATCQPGNPRIANVAKGSAFVQMYAVYEFTVRGAVRAGISTVKVHGIPISVARLELLGLLLDAELNSARDCGKEKVWLRRIDLMVRTASPDPITTPDNTFPHNGTQFRISQLEVIWNLFGVTSPTVPAQKFNVFIGEMVDKRNGIAHGQFTAEEVGRNHSKAEVLTKISDCRTLCHYLLTELESRCAIAGNVSR